MYSQFPLWAFDLNELDTVALVVHVYHGMVVVTFLYDESVDLYNIIVTVDQDIPCGASRYTGIATMDTLYMF